MTTRDKGERLHQKIYDFLLYIYPLLSKYPKYEKFSLQTATRNAILEMLQDELANGSVSEKDNKNRFTKGHYGRGVE